MRYFCFTTLLFFSVSLAQAKELAVDFSYQNYNEARNADSWIEFHMESTKAGIFTTSFVGVIKKFTVLAQVEKNILTNASIDFAVLDMETDNKSRNKKMYDKCFNHSLYPKINVEFITPSSIGQETVVDAIMTVRGAQKNIKATVNTRKNGDTLVVSGSSNLRLSELDIPDPSIIVASVRDLVEIRFQMELKVK